MIKTIVVAVLLSSALTACSSSGSGRNYVIGGNNMEPALRGCDGCVHDHVHAVPPSSAHPVRVGSIVVVRAPASWSIQSTEIVTRVLALGGQTIKGRSTDGGLHETVSVSLHGAAGPWRVLSEPYVFLDGPDNWANFGPVTIPAGRVWLMGDHRDDSADSRLHCGSFDDPSALIHCDPAAAVPSSDVIGVVTAIVAPPNRVRKF